ncbi:MAG: cation diffusion facilitator family transporter [Oscillospiraceae bacterium]
MIKILAKIFIKDFDNVTDNKIREKYGILGGILGLICNALLFTIKFFIGTFMNSIAIISDAFNNFSDMGSSAISIIGAKMSNRKPDKQHPFGHGRIEYISSLIVSFLIMFVGFELFRTSLDKTIHPQKIEFSIIMIIILSISVLVKVWMFSYNRYIGKKINSTVQNATAFDSLNDVIATGAVIISTIIGHFISFPIDGIIGLAVSIFILYSGFKVAKDTITVLLGSPPSHELVHQIEEHIMSGEGIVGVHDLIVHDYGPGRVMASVHAEVPDDINIVKIHEVIDLIEQMILRDLGIHIVIHMDPISVNNERITQIKKHVTEIIVALNPAFTIHDFRLTDGESNINLIFDLVVPCEMAENERTDTINEITKELKAADNRYNAVIQVDNNFE